MLQQAMTTSCNLAAQLQERVREREKRKAMPMDLDDRSGNGFPADHVEVYHRGHDEDTCVSSVTGHFFGSDSLLNQAGAFVLPTTDTSPFGKEDTEIRDGLEQEWRTKPTSTQLMKQQQKKSDVTDKSERMNPPQRPERCVSVCGSEPEQKGTQIQQRETVVVPTSIADSPSKAKSKSTETTPASMTPTHKSSSVRRSWTEDTYSASPPRKPTRIRSAMNVYQSQGQDPTTLAVERPIDVETITELSLHLSQRSPSSAATSAAKKRLTFWETRMVGRDEQFSLLKESLQSHVRTATSGLTKSHIVQIHGEPGTGKSRLAESLKSTQVFQSHDNPLFVQGKFDLLLREEPYAGIISACEDIAERILQLDNVNQDGPEYKLGSRIVDNLIATIDTEELVLLITMVPLLGLILGINPMENQQAYMRNKHRHTDETFIDRKKTQFQETFRRFMRVICQSFFPVVFLLDDLQFADDESLALLQNMLEPEQEYSLFCIALYRSSEVKGGLQKSLRYWEEQSLAGRLDRTLISVGNLSQQSVTAYLQDLLDSTPASASDGTDEGSAATSLDGLSSICYRRTQGNIFFLNNFLTMLNTSGYLVFDTIQHKWTWHEQEIEVRTQSTRNVVELLMERMTTLESQSSRELLRLAACLGSTCKVSVLQLLWSNMFGHPESCKDLLDQVFKTSLKHLFTEGFLQELADGTYKWTHDQIRSAAILLTPELGLEDFQQRVGEAMAEQLVSADLESMIFVVAHLVNQGQAPKDKRKIVQFARLNLQASKRATAIAAFNNAKTYAAKGLLLLPDEKWQDFNALCHELYTYLIQAERVCGDIPAMEKHCKELIEAQMDKPISMRLPATYNLCNGIFYSDALGRGKEALEIGFNALETLGCHFPRNKLAIKAKTLACILSLKRIRNKISKGGEDFALHMMANPPGNIEESIKLLYSLMPLTYLARDARFPLVISRLVHYTFEYGVSAYAPPAIAGAAPMFAGALNDLQGAACFAKLALKLMEIVKYRRIVPGTMMIAYTLGLIWTVPAGEATAQLQMAHEFGLRVGEREYCGKAGFSSTCCSFMSGYTLDKMVSNCNTFLVQLERTRTDMYAQFTDFQLMAFLSLQGEDTDEVLDRLNSRSSGAPSSDNPTTEKDQIYVFWTKKLLSTYMGDFDVCAEMSLAHSDGVKKALLGSPSSMMDIVCRGLSCLVVARRTGQRSVLREGKHLLAIISDWANQGNPNVVHFEAIMNAELSAIQEKSRKKVLEKYQRAVDLAKLVGCLHDAALFYECWGLYAWECLGAKHEARVCLQQSMHLFESWGAHAKVQKMRSQYVSLLGSRALSTEMTQASRSPPSSIDLSVSKK